MESNCKQCGTRHRSASRARRICTGLISLQDKANTAAERIAHAAEARMLAEHNFAAYLRTGSQFRLEEARRHYAVAFEQDGEV